MNITGYLKHFAGLSETTQRAYKTTLSMLNRKIGGGEPSDDQVRVFLHGFGAGNTVQRHKYAIHSYYKYMNRDWHFTPREFVKAKRTLPQYLTRVEILKVQNTAVDQDEFMFIKTLFMTGLRISELLCLKASNIIEDGIRFTGKGDKEHIVPIVDERFRQELQRFAKEAGEERLFPDSYYKYWALLKDMCRRARVRPVSCHKIRHSRAIDLMKRGAELSVIQAFLGHDNPSTTMIYLGVTQQDLKGRLKEIGG